MTTEGVLSAAGYEALWGPWLGREADFYEACFAHSAAWGWADEGGLAVAPEIDEV